MDHKHLSRGDYPVDDRLKNGVDRFKREHIRFAIAAFPNWDAVTRSLVGKHGSQSG